MYVSFYGPFTAFIPVSGCVGRAPSALFFPGAYKAVKTALVTVGSYNENVDIQL